MTVGMTALLCLAAIASNQTTAEVAGTGIGISTSELAALRGSGLAIVVPTYVPKGMRLVDYDFSREGNPVLDIAYLRWEDTKKHTWFALQGASDGLGDPFFDLPGGDVLDATGSLKGKNPLFGRFELEYVWTPKHKLFHTTWYEYKTKGYPRLWLIDGALMEPKDALKVFESVRVLKPAK